MDVRKEEPYSFKTVFGDVEGEVTVERRKLFYMWAR
jgi:hypothetical protein